MLSKKNTQVFAAVAALTAWTGQAVAAPTNPPFHLRGSDTWFDVITEALATAKTNMFAVADLVYDGTGSGNAETQMLNNLQSIGPMSRNFKASVVGNGGSHVGWAPTVQNAGGLDAPVWFTRTNAGRITDLSLPINGNDPSGVANPKYAAPNDKNAVGTFGTPGSGYTQLLGIVLAGVDGSGTVPACADARRVQAVADLAAKNNVFSIAHIYRRDDNSGTTTTIQEKLQVGRFCNGYARGVLGTNQGVNTNLNNQDFDPIRRPCPAPGGANETTCTDMTTGLACKASDNNVNCTQGLVVALSVGDPGHTDVTESIAYRVANDATGSTMGYAGRTGVKLGINTTGPTINTIGYTDTNIRLDQYMLSRVLFIQYASDNTDLGVPGAGIPGGGGMNQFNQEATFWNWLTDPTGAINTDGAPGRCHLDPILDKWGFLSCTTDCQTTPTAPNLCAKTPFFTASSFPAQCGPYSGSGGPAWGYGAITNTAQAACCSTGGAPDVNKNCPAVGNLPANSACTKAADCAMGLGCSDAAGIGINICG
jgi:hypothetical protein